MNQPLTSDYKSGPLPTRTDLHLLRKIWHMATGALVLALYYANPEMEFQKWGNIVMALAVTGFLIEFIRLRNPALNRLIMKFFSPFLRHDEKTSISGFPFYALGCAISIFAFEEKIAILSIIFLVLSDPISSLFGILYGKDKIMGGKSLQGCLAGFGVCYLTTLIYGLSFHEAGMALFLFSFLAGIIGCLSELIPFFFDDNLTIPVLSGLGLTLLNKIFLIF